MTLYFTCMLFVSILAQISSESTTSRIGWADCMSTGPPSSSAIQRAWRRMALNSHPDKLDSGATSDSFLQEATTREFLKDPMRYRLHHLFTRGSTDLWEFGVTTTQFRNVSVGVERRGEWPYLRLKAEVTLPMELTVGAHWALSFGAEAPYCHIT